MGYRNVNNGQDPSVQGVFDVARMPVDWLLRNIDRVIHSVGAHIQEMDWLLPTYMLSHHFQEMNGLRFKHSSWNRLKAFVARQVAQERKEHEKAEQKDTFKRDGMLFVVAMKWMNLANEEQRAAVRNHIAAEDFKIFHNIVKQDDVQAVKKLVQLALAAGGGAFVAGMLRSREHEGFRHSACRGQTHMVRTLADAAKDTGDQELLPEMLRSRDYEAIRKAAANGHKDTVEELARIARECGGNNLVMELIKIAEKECCHREIIDLYDRLKSECGTGACSVQSPTQLSELFTQIVLIKLPHILKHQFARAGFGGYSSETTDSHGPHMHNHNHATLEPT